MSAKQFRNLLTTRANRENSAGNCSVYFVGILWGKLCFLKTHPVAKSRLLNSVLVCFLRVVPFTRGVE